MNFYERGLTIDEVNKWSETSKEKNDLNSTLVRNKDGNIEEVVWRAGTGSIPPGKYAGYLQGCIHYLEQAIPYL